MINWLDSKGKKRKSINSMFKLKLKQVNRFIINILMVVLFKLNDNMCRVS